MISRHFFRSVLIFATITQVFIKSGTVPPGKFAIDKDDVWGTKPLLIYFVLTPSIASELQEEIDIAPKEFRVVQEIARKEDLLVQNLFEESLPVIQNARSPLWMKRLGVWSMGFNPRLEAILHISDQSLEKELGHQTYQELLDWIETSWEFEREKHSKFSVPSSARTFQVYATRYDAGGAYKVALPDKCLKFANGGSHICDGDGYQVGANYTVFLSYKTSTAAIVGESGPWNVDDNFWSGWNDPQPRRMFADLATGISEAQAAYFNGYNGGLDQFGRKVTAPYGIDLARQVSIDIGLQPGVNDWITVTFPWTESWGISGGQGTPGGAGATGATAFAIVPVQIASPQPDGSIVHKVEYGQTLWEIAVTYNVSLQSLYQLNSLTEDDVIWVGQELIVRPPGSITPAWTDTPIGTLELTGSPTTISTLERRTVTALARAKQATETAMLGEVLAEMEDSSTDEENTTSAVYSGRLDLWIFVGFLIMVSGLILWAVGRWLRYR